MFGEGGRATGFACRPQDRVAPDMQWEQVLYVFSALQTGADLPEIGREDQRIQAGTGR